MRKHPTRPTPRSVSAVRERAHRYCAGMPLDPCFRPLLDKMVSGDEFHTQLLDRPFFPTGAAYAVRTDILRREKTLFVDPLRMVEMDSLRALDVDEEIDLILAEAAAKRWGFTVIEGRR